MEPSKTRRAAAAFSNRNYEEALLLYEELGAQHGERLFALNIELCRKKIKLQTIPDLRKVRIEAENVDQKRLKQSEPTLDFLDSAYFPATNSKLSSYVAEAVMQSGGKISVLSKFLSKNHKASKAIADGILSGMQLHEMLARKPRILVAGHDLRFVQPFIDYFSRYFEVAIDRWTATNKHDPKVSLALLNNADLIWCEWCCGNAVWYSKNIKGNQKLVVRLHKFEIDTAYPAQVIWENVSSLIFIADGMQLYANQKHKITCFQHLLYNGFDVDAVNSAYAGERDRFSIALLGHVPYIKRLDRGIDFFEAAWKIDKKYSFHIKGKAAEELPWVWEKEHEFFETQEKRLDALRAAGACITKEGYDDRVHSWLGQKGFVLSASDIEGSHQAVAEAMACGTIPIIFGDWVGTYAARAIYPSELCFSSLEPAVEFMSKLANDTREYEKLSERVRAFAHENFNDKKIAHKALLILYGQQPSSQYIPISDPKRILIFTDLSINVIDGSSVWLLSLIELLLQDKNTIVILVSRERDLSGYRFAKYFSTARFFLDTFDGGFSPENPEKYVDFVATSAKQHLPDRIIVRCSEPMTSLLQHRLEPGLVAKMLYYLVGDNYPTPDFLNSVKAVLVQTEASRQRFKSKFPAIAKAKQIRILSPMIPGYFLPSVMPPEDELIITYSGKLCRDYMAKEMTELISSLDKEYKFLLCIAKYYRPDGEQYIKDVRSRLAKAREAGKALVFEQLDRETVAELQKGTHVGWSVRDNRMAESSEISTKVLEYCSLGKPVLLNRHESNITLLGSDYPLFVDSNDSIKSLLRELKMDRRFYFEQANRCLTAVEKFRMQNVYTAICDVL